MAKTTRRTTKRRVWTHVGGDLDASYDGHRYVTFRDLHKKELLFISRAALKKALALFKPEPYAE